MLTALVFKASGANFCTFTAVKGTGAVQAIFLISWPLLQSSGKTIYQVAASVISHNEDSKVNLVTCAPFGKPL